MSGLSGPGRAVMNVLTQYMRGKNIINHRPLVLQFNQSFSGPSTALVGLSPYSFTSTLGYTFGPVSIADISLKFPRSFVNSIERIKRILSAATPESLKKGELPKELDSLI